MGPAAQKPNQPVACSLTGDEMAEREAELRATLGASVIEAVRDRTGLRLELRDSPGLSERVAKLVEQERACCPFLDIGLERGGGRIVVQIAGPPEAEAVIDGFQSLASADGRL